MHRVSRRSFLATTTAAGLSLTVNQVSGKHAQRNPDAEAIECMLNDDTSCAVDVWQGQFESNRYNDEIRQTYFVSLMVHGLRSLDKGKLNDAIEAYETAVSILPSSNAIALNYLADATTTYGSLISLDNMELNWNSSPTIEQSWEGEYLSHTNQYGAETTVFAFTAKETGWFNYFYGPTGNNAAVAYRIKFKPMSNTGFVTLFLGTLPNGNPVFFDLSFFTNWRAYWSVFTNLETVTETLHQGAEIGVDLDQWHSIEARLKPNTVEIWLDYQYLATIPLANLDYTNIGYGAGLHQDSYSMTFTALFDDEVMYKLK